MEYMNVQLKNNHPLYFSCMLDVFSGGLLQTPVRMMAQPQPVRRIEPPPRFPNRNDRGPELILRTKEERRSVYSSDCFNFVVQATASLWDIFTEWASCLLPETETVSAGDQESAHPHASAPETALREESAHLDGRAEWCPATLSSSPSSV